MTLASFLWPILAGLAFIVVVALVIGLALAASIVIVTTIRAAARAYLAARDARWWAREGHDAT